MYINHKMFKNLFYLFSKVILILLLSISNIFADIINKIEIRGNDRIADETIKMFMKVEIGEKLNENKTNIILKNLYETNFFNDVSIKLEKNNLIISVKENPLIENIIYNGIKSNTLKEQLTQDLKLQARSSYNEILLKEDIDKIVSALKDIGYYFSKVDVNVIELKNNKIDVIFEVNLGDKAKIKKITFLGDKIFKDRKLRSIIVSEEYKFWKIISGKKYLNENLINFDQRLLRSFYLNKGYYDVEINPSFAKLVNNNQFELVFNINAKNKFYFGDLKLELPTDYDSSNFSNLNNVFDEIKNKPYSINSVEEIIDEIDNIAITEQYEAIKATVEENIFENKINLTFKIQETEKFFVEKINIYGNNITREGVIRNQLYIDEGDPYNEILSNKSLNEIKSLNFFRNVSSEIIQGKNENSKIINITVEEKPTGEIMAGAGFGTDGELFEVGIKENNYLGKGLKIESNLSLGSDRVTGTFKVRDPNFNDTNKSVNYGIQANEIDKLSAFGYKSKKIGGSLGTSFEFLKDVRLGLETSSFLEDIETDSTASARQKKQEGSYFDTYLKFNFDYDKRNQKFKTSDGFRSYYSIDLPLLSDNNTLTNFYNYKIFSELYENNISSFGFSLKTANSLTGDDVKLSERLYIPQKKLRGFVNGGVGPKDGDDFIGGNYYAVLNFNSTLPQILPNSQNIDISTFLDIANLWGVDDASLDESSEIRSSIGLGVDWFTPVGPLNFSFAQPISKGSTDKTETFRFNLGTSF